MYICKHVHIRRARVRNAITFDGAFGPDSDTRHMYICIYIYIYILCKRTHTHTHTHTHIHTHTSGGLGCGLPSPLTAHWAQTLTLAEDLLWSDPLSPADDDGEGDM